MVVLTYNSVTTSDDRACIGGQVHVGVCWETARWSYHGCMMCKLVKAIPRCCTVTSSPPVALFHDLVVFIIWTHYIFKTEWNFKVNLSSLILKLKKWGSNFLSDVDESWSLLPVQVLWKRLVAHGFSQESLHDLILGLELKQRPGPNFTVPISTDWQNSIFTSSFYAQIL